MKTRNHGLDEREMELVKLLMADCQSTGDIQSKLKKLFAGTIEQMLEVEMDEHLGYEKNSVEGNNSGNSRNGYGKKTISSDYGDCEIAVPRDRNGEFEPRVIEKRQTRTDEIEQKIMAMYSKGMSQRDIEDTLRDIYGSDISRGYDLEDNRQDFARGKRVAEPSLGQDLSRSFFSMELSSIQKKTIRSSANVCILFWV